MFGPIAPSIFRHDYINLQDKNSSPCFFFLLNSHSTIFGAILILYRFRTFSMFCHFGFQPRECVFFHTYHKFIPLVIIRKTYYFCFRLLPLSLYPHLIFIFHSLSYNSPNSRYSFICARIPSFHRSVFVNS